MSLFFDSGMMNGVGYSGTRSMDIRQKSSSYAINLLILLAFWSVIIVTLASVGGVGVIWDLEASARERLFPFVVLAFAVVTLWVSRLIFNGGRYARINSEGVVLTGVFRDRSFLWQEIVEVELTETSADKLKKVTVKAVTGEASSVYTADSFVKKSEVVSAINQYCGDDVAVI